MKLFGKRATTPRKTRLQEKSDFWQRSNRNVRYNVLSENEEDRLERMLNKPPTFGKSTFR